LESEDAGSQEIHMNTHLKIQLLPHREHCTPTENAGWLMLFSEIIPAYSDDHILQKK
jgi:hypothetical protein